MTFKAVKKNKDGIIEEERYIKLTPINMIAIFVALAPIYGLLLNLNIAQTRQKTIIDNHEAYVESQKTFNYCVCNASLVEFGKSIYFYNDQLIYRGGNTKNKK